MTLSTSSLTPSHLYVESPACPLLPIESERRAFLVNRIFCVGRNYADHALEMGSDPEKEPPFFFMKPSSSLVHNTLNMPFPLATSNLHHEVELAVAIGQKGTKINPARALDYIACYGVSLDMTRRDLQSEAKAHGRPWDMAKGFDQSCPCSTLKKVSSIGHPQKGIIQLSVNGTLRQKGDLSHMIWDVAHIIASLSNFVTLMPGDLLLTGTPSGVGRVEPGDLIEAEIEGVGRLKASYKLS